MNALPLRPRPSREVIDVAIAAHGPLRVGLAALAALLRPRARPPDAADLPASLRRDVGLPPEEPTLPSQRVGAVPLTRSPLGLHR